MKPAPNPIPNALPNLAPADKPNIAFVVASLEYEGPPKACRYVFFCCALVMMEISNRGNNNNFIKTNLGRPVNIKTNP